MKQELTWIDRLMQPTRRTFADVEKTGAELLDLLESGAALTSAQKRSLGQVLDGLEAPEVRTITGITADARRQDPAGLSSLPQA